MLLGTWQQRQLLGSLIRRDVQGRYRGSLLGLSWAIVHPLILLGLYTFVFAIVFKARWGSLGSGEPRTHFTQMLFVGMIVHGVIGEVLQRAPGVIIAQPNFVKKVVFPLQILPLVAVGSALIHASISLAVLVFILALANQSVHWTLVLLPFVWTPLVLFACGIAWLFGSVGVFVRDTSQMVAMLTTILLFASPVFYPISALPVSLQPWLALNPLAWIIEQSRAVLIAGRLPDLTGLIVWTLVSTGFSILGFIWFQKTRQGFADVV
ncbi:MAG: ABC transporter permease [Ramlibacter sp.]|nr:ABC transporter permease [Ramlibacter sp.]